MKKSSTSKGFQLMTHDSIGHLKMLCRSVYRFKSSGVWVWMETLSLTTQRWKNASVRVWIQLNTVGWGRVLEHVAMVCGKSSISSLGYSHLENFLWTLQQQGKSGAEHRWMFFTKGWFMFYVTFFQSNWCNVNCQLSIVLIVFYLCGFKYDCNNVV